MAQQIDTGEIREGARALRGDISREKINDRLEDMVSDRPMVEHLLRWKIVLRAVAVAVVIALIFLVFGHPRMGAVLMVLAFFGTWLFLGARSYERRRPTKPADDDEDEEES